MKPGCFFRWGLLSSDAKKSAGLESLTHPTPTLDGLTHLYCLWGPLQPSEVRGAQRSERIQMSLTLWVGWIQKNFGIQIVNNPMIQIFWRSDSDRGGNGITTQYYENYWPEKLIRNQTKMKILEEYDSHANSMAILKLHQVSFNICFFLVEDIVRELMTSTVDLWTTGRLGAPTPSAIQNPCITFDSPLNYYQPTVDKSLTNNTNSQLTYILYMY